MASSGQHGVVLFTLGTYAGSAATLPLCEMEKLSRAFSVVPQRVVWQMKGEPPPSLQVGENTRIVPWMPQNDLLGKRAFFGTACILGFRSPTALRQKAGYVE